MKTEYRRDMQHSYLVIIPEQQLESSYPLRMITENTIPGLLTCSCRRMDEDVLLYYDVTSRISLKQRCSCKKITGEEMLSLCKSLAYTLAELDEYLLEADSLLLEMEYIFVDAQIREVLFCCVPGIDRKIEDSFCSLMEELLPLLDHQNQEGIMIGYGFYHYAVQEVFSLEGLMKQIEVCTGKKEQEIQICAEQAEPEETQEEDIQMLFDEEKHERYPAAVTLAAAGIFTGALSGWYFWKNYPSLIWIAAVLGVMGIVSGAVVFLVTKKKKAAHKEESIRWEEKKVEIREETEEEKEGWDEPCFTEILCMPEEHTEFFLESKGVSSPPVYLREKKQWFIGKMEDMADILLPSSAVSRLHARIRIEQGHCYLCDMNSKNGTWVNGKVIPGEKEMEVKAGDEIKFADLSYILRKSR